MLLAEELLLLLTDDASGRLLVPADQADAALGGANLVELASLGKADLSGAGDAGKPGRIIVRDPSPPGDEVLDAALQTVLAHPGSKPSALIRPLGKNLRRELYGRLAASGVLQAEQGRVLGLFPAHRWPAQDASHETQVRQALSNILLSQAAPDSRSAALIALLHALRCEHKVVDLGACGLSRRQLRARAAQIAEGDWASAAVRKAIEETIAAIAAVASAAAATGSG
jgi:Golgi phosphoprotein 3 GPP34